MAKVTFNIALDGVPATFSKERLRTANMRGGTDIWVPESYQAATGVIGGPLVVTHNGEYIASQQGIFGWSQVNVMVNGGNDADINNGTKDDPEITPWEAPPASGADDNGCGTSSGINGSYNGSNYNVSVDSNGYLVWTEI